MYSGWTGCDSTSGANNETCNIALNANSTVTASFRRTGGGGGGGGGAEEAVAAPALTLPLLGPDGLVTKTVDREVAAIGDVLTYTITFTNPKDKTIEEVVVEDVFDSRLDDVEVVSTSKGEATVDGNTVTVDGGIELAPGEQIELVVRATISGRASPGDVIDNTATLESPDLSVHASNTVTTTILAGELPDTGHGLAQRAPRWLPFALVVGGLVALAAVCLRQRRRGFPAL